MPLHSKDDINDDALDDVYASSDLGQVIPKYKMPELEHDPRHVFAVVRDELMLDGNSRQNLAMKWRWREKMKAAGKPTDKPTNRI